jgi:DNA-binding winged helix-turn-helix (wHTH) protein
MKSSESIQLGTKYFHVKTKELRDEEGEVIPLRAQSAEVLGILIKTPGQLVGKHPANNGITASKIIS